MDNLSTTTNELSERISAAALKLEDKVIAWRRDIHEHPELSYQETRTAALAAEHLKKLGIEVKTGVGITGVLGILKGGKPGPVVALRADMDALPVEERVDVPFKSTAKATVARPDRAGHACLRPRRACRDPDGRRRGAGRNARGDHRHGDVPVPAQRGRRLRRPAERRAGDDRRRRPRRSGALGDLRPARHLGAGLGRDRAAARRADGERRQPQDQHPRPADPRLLAVARRRSRRDGGADHPRAADHPEPPARCDAHPLGADDLDGAWRRARQHHSRHPGNAGHHPHPRRGRARRHLEADREDRDGDRRLAGRARRGQGP